MSVELVQFMYQLLNLVMQILTGRFFVVVAEVSISYAEP